MNAKKNNTVKNLSPYFVLGIIICSILLILNMQGSSVHTLETGKLIEALQKDEVTEITITPKSEESVYYIEGKLEDYKSDESFETLAVEAELENITKLIRENEIAAYDTDRTYHFYHT